MTVLVLGATSQIGRCLLPRLHARGAEVLALSRRAREGSPGVRWLTGELPHAMPVIEPPSAIISFGPLLRFAEWLGTVALSPSTRVIATSSMSAESKQASDVPAERALAQTLQAGEAALAAVCERHGSPWTVFRPTLIYGTGLDKSLTPIARRAMQWRVFPLPAGRGLRQPVHADDIAQAVMAALDRPEAAGRVLPLGGGERLPAGEMFARVRQSLPVATLPVPVPAWMLRMGRHTVPRLRGPLTRLEADLVADNSELQRLLGVSPRPFHPDASCWTPVAPP
ncbi:NAD-dependent epimerase/dehydratase family protein [Dyella soli]|uniref:NAD-dependent epimerase/dehydratase family protein n=1 Tax=Dyella soli TaxID=522319 RepID=A0A4R0YI76_9GAMM|nr:NAD-dependent epimerase/dehydratase family protein [Dyella soli]TCI06872.1 NAD-dependent epimerase/dehydratase family protein [Dyella soli]